MALTFTKTKEGVIGDLRYWAGSITLDSSYVTGGYAITAANFLMGSTVYFLHLGQGSVGGVMPEWDQTNKEIKVWFPTGGASAPTALNAPVLGTVTGAVPAGGTAVTSTSAQPTLTIAAEALTGGKGIEVGSAADLSTVIIQAFAIGQ